MTKKKKSVFSGFANVLEVLNWFVEGGRIEKEGIMCDTERAVVEMLPSYFSHHLTPVISPGMSPITPSRAPHPQTIPNYLEFPESITKYLFTPCILHLEALSYFDCRANSTYFSRLCWNISFAMKLSLKFCKIFLFLH